MEDTDAIRNLKARYAAYCYDKYNPDKIAEMFVEDAAWESGPLAVWPESAFAQHRPTPIRRITVYYGIIVYVLGFIYPLLHR